MQTVGSFQVQIYSDSTFTRGSQDNLHSYHAEYLEADDYELLTQFAIKVYECSKLLSSAIIGSVGGGTGIHDTSVIYENSRLLICCADNIFCLSIPSLQLIWKTKADSTTCFEIYKYEEDYIVHGEIEISRISKDGQVLWQQSGADIFTTLKGGKDFELTKDFIIAKDFESRVYKYDYNGRDLTDKTQFQWLRP